MKRVRQALATVAIGMLATGFLAACEKGPAQRAGEKVDDAVDRITGKGPAEKAGERIDEATKELRGK